MAAACVCSHCHISPLTNAKATMTDGCSYMVQDLALFPLFSLQLILDPPARLLAVSSKSMSKTCRIWYAFFFLSQVRNTCLCLCFYIMQLVLVLYCQSSYNVFSSLPLLIISFLQISRVHLKKVKWSHLVFLSELTFSSQWIGRGEITTSCWQLNYYHWYTHTTTSTFSFLYSLPQKYEHIHKNSFTTSVSNILPIAMFISLKVFIKDDRGFPSYTIPI